MKLLAGESHVRALANDDSTRAMEVRRCPVCGGDTRVAVFPKRLPWLMRCADCGLKFVSPQPTDAELDEIYGPEYFVPFGGGAEFADAYRQMKEASASRLLRGAERHLAPGKLLDVGSGLGEMLAAATRRGWEAHGIECNPYAFETASERNPGNVFLGTLDTFRPPGGPFDLITCVEVIEHLRSPESGLRRMFALLRPGGFLALTTPNATSWPARLLGPRWPHYHRDHLWYFHRESLTAIARAAGFEIVGCRPAWKTFNLRYILGILAQTDNFHSARRLAQIGLRRLPAPLLTMLLPPLAEGCLLLSIRKPGQAPCSLYRHGVKDTTCESQSRFSDSFLVARRPGPRYRRPARSPVSESTRS